VAAVVAALAPAWVRADLSAPVQRWPGNRIVFDDRLSGLDRWALARAVDAWNTSGVDVRFERASGLAVPGVTISYAGPNSAGLGQAQVGYVPFRSGWVRLRRPSERDPRQDRYVMAAVIAHELGHVLGLAHATPCNVMAPDLGPWIGAADGCRRAPKGKWRCDLLSHGDVTQAVAVYGGAVREHTGRRWCRR
jgi:hypothetical protein